MFQLTSITEASRLEVQINGMNVMISLALLNRKLDLHRGVRHGSYFIPQASKDLEIQNFEAFLVPLFMTASIHRKLLCKFAWCFGF
jgi:hypothetical protein